MDRGIAEEIARTLETEPRLLPVLPELLADLDELGTSAEEIVAALRAGGVPRGGRALDLGCGKGAVAVALAERLGLAVDGIDAFPPFLESARALAEARGVGGSCSFREGDLRERLGSPGDFDAVLLLSVGPVLGDHERTVAGLRTLVPPGGLVVLEDGFLAEGVAPPEGCEGYAPREETLRRLTARGDALVYESVSPPDATRALNEENTEKIRRRARALRAERPDLAGAIDAYVARQERETEILGTDLICAIWVLRRAGGDS